MIFGIVYSLVLVLLVRFNLIKRVEEAWIRNFDPVQKQNYVEMPDPSMRSCLASSASPSSRANSFADGANSTIRTIHAVTLILFALFLFEPVPMKGTFFHDSVLHTDCLSFELILVFLCPYFVCLCV